MIGQQCSPSVRAGWLAAAALLMLLSAGSASRAAVRYVNGDAAGPAHDGLSWATAFTAVKQGLTVAAPGDEVWVAKGTYLETITVPAVVSLYGGFTGLETTRTERNWKGNPTVLDGTGSTEGPVVRCLANTVVDGLTIRNGILGVRISGPATLSNNTISGNFGNGVDVPDSSGPAALSNNTISNNSVGVLVYGSTTLVNNTISGNNGPGVLVYGTVSLTNNILAFNGRYGLYKEVGNIAVFSHNNVYGNTEGAYFAFTPPGGQDNISLDPKLANPYRNVHIQPDSPCRDAGDDAAVIGTMDIDGQPRIQGAHVDIGSDESDGTTWSVPSVTWHVSPGGDDGNDGRTWATAMKTIPAALSLIEGADEVWVAKGTYTGRLFLSAGVSLYGGFAGTETSRDERDWKVNPTILDGTGESGVTCLQNTVVDGFIIRNGYGVQTLGTATLANNTISGNGEVGVSVDYGTVTLTNNTISGNRLYGLSVYGYAALSNNTISGNGGSGVHAYPGMVTLTNNTVFGNESYGVYVHGTATLTNNTVSGNLDDGVRVYADGSATLTNNIVAFNGGFGFCKPNGWVPTFSHNDVYGNSNGEYDGYAPPPGQGNVSLDPLFVDRVNDDYHLQSGSPCIDVGDDSVVTAGEMDLDAKPRILGAHVDIGAYEYGIGPVPFTMADVGQALGICSGLLSCTEGDLARLNVESAGAGLDVRDAICLIRKVAGLDVNP